MYRQEHLFYISICIITFYDIEIMKTIWASFYLYIDQQAP